MLLPIVRRSGSRKRERARAVQDAIAILHLPMKSSPSYSGERVFSFQYFGTEWSISSLQALMPPFTLFTYLKPCWRRNSSAFIERLPDLQCR